MRKIILLISFSCCFLFLLAQTDKMGVKDVAKAYQDALMKNDAATAFTMMSKNSQQYFKTLLVQTKKYNKAQVEALSFVDKMALLSIRNQTTDEELKKMKDNDLFIFAVQNGIIPKNADVTKNTITETKGDNAVIYAYNNGQKSPLGLPFVKENKVWKVDLFGLLAKSNEMIALMMTDNAKSTAFVLQMLSRNGKKVDASIWNTVE